MALFPSRKLPNNWTSYFVQLEPLQDKTTKKREYIIDEAVKNIIMNSRGKVKICIDCQSDRDLRIEVQDYNCYASCLTSYRRHNNEIQVIPV